MKNVMIGMLPSSGTYVLAHLDGTPFGQGEYETLLRDFDKLKDDALSLHARIAGHNQGRLDLEKLRAEEADGLNAEIEILRRELTQVRAALFKDLDRNQDDVTTPHLAIVAGNALAELRATAASQTKKIEALEACLVSKDAALRDAVVSVNGRLEGWDPLAKTAFRCLENALDIQPAPAAS